MHAKDGTPRHRRRCRGVSRYTLCAVTLHAIRLTGSSSSALRCGGKSSVIEGPCATTQPTIPFLVLTRCHGRRGGHELQQPSRKAHAAQRLSCRTRGIRGVGGVGGIEPVAEGAARRPGRRAGRMGWAREGNEGRSQVLGGCFCCALPTIRPSSSMSPETIPLIEGAGWQVDMMRDLLLIL